MKNVTWQITIELGNGKMIEKTVVNSVEDSKAMADRFATFTNNLILEGDHSNSVIIIPARHIMTITLTKKENIDDQNNC